MLGRKSSRAARERLRDFMGSAWDVRQVLVDLPVPATVNGPCANPLLWWDRDERRPFLGPCDARRVSKCSPCALRAQARVRRVAGTGAASQLGQGRHLYHLIVTGPGDEGHLRWDVRGPRAGRPVCGCEDAARDGAGVWNRSAAKRWNHLITLLRREFGADVQFFRGVEPQQRGFLHLHVLLGTSESVAAQQVQDLALTAGFGCNVKLDPLPARNYQRAVAYVTKYVTKDVTGHDAVPWEELDCETGELVASDPSYRVWSQSRDFGCTMREHRDAIRAQARRRAAEIAAGLVALVDVLGAVVLDGDPLPSPP